MKQFVKQMVPMVLIISITVVMSLFLYRRIMVKEEENCWSLLEESSNSVTKEMQLTFTDDINMLHLAANIIGQDTTDRIDTYKLEPYRSCTVFSRVDVIYPNDRIVLENGTEQALRSELSFDSVVREGEHMSSRMIDTETGKEAVIILSRWKKAARLSPFLPGFLSPLF